MSMDKPTKPTNLMPRTFGGIKNNFSQSLQTSGYEPNIPAIYGGDNLNYQLNSTGQELDYCEKFCDFINAMPIGKTITVDENNKLIYGDYLDYSTRHIGEIVKSVLPLTDTGLHLLDGSLILYGSYQKFVDYIASLYNSGDYSDLFITESAWQTSVATYGVCGKFVYDSTNNTVRLPKISGFIEGTLNDALLGDLTEAGLPNITGTVRHLMLQSSAVHFAYTGAFYDAQVGAESYAPSSTTNIGNNIDNFGIDASRSNSIYGNSNTVQPQSIKVLYYIVISTKTKTEIEVDIDEIATDLNGKADADLSNLPNTFSKNFDGQWSNDFATIANEITWNSNSQPRTFSLASYLPDDNYDYEVLITANCNTGTTSGNFAGVTLYTDLNSEHSVYVCYAQTRTNSAMGGRGSVIIPVGTGRTITQYSSTSSNANGTYSIYAMGYRRIGTNS